MEKNYVEVAKSLYPEREKGQFPYVYGYDTIVEYIGKVAVQVDDDDYQGDSRVLFDDPEKGVGHLNFGWGSCSGCDALEGCSNYDELADLIRSMEESVVWKTKAEMLEFFKAHDWQGDYSWHAKEQKEFIEKAIAYLEG